MSYIGASPANQSTISGVDYFNGNGTTTSFTLSRNVSSALQMQVVVNNVIQNPSSAFTVLSNVITFTSAPSSGSNNIYVIYGSNNNTVNVSGSGTNPATSGATGGGTDAIFIQNQKTVNTSYTIPGSLNAQSVGPITISDSSAVTITGVSRWVVL
jgi:hypothetical protein